MSRKRGFGLVIIIAIISSMVSSLLTVLVMKNNFTVNTSGNKTEINVNEAGKSQNIYHAVSDKAMPSIVGIQTTTMDRNNIYSIPQSGAGTGVIVDSNGYILTNSHVVSDGQAEKVNVLFNDETELEGKVIWNDPQLDLAIVRVEKTGLVAADLGDSDKVRTGDISIAIGNPLGLQLQKSVTQGIISGLNRTIQTENYNMTGLIQTDASINPGNSGGPLLNQSGQVIGINTAKKAEAEGLGFAIPINTAKSIISSVISKGTYDKVTLGIKGMDVSTAMSRFRQKLAVDSGVLISEVMSNNPAQRSGLQAGDIIVKVGDKEITGMSDLTKVLYTYSSGSNVKVVINREGKEKTVEVKF